MVNTTSEHWLRKWRRKAGKSQVWCAAQAGVTRQTWINWELGRVVPNPNSMRRILAMTDGEISVEDFYPQICEALQDAA